MWQYLAEHYIEIIGTILSLIYLYLSIKQKISLWIFGFLCSAMYVVVFYQSKFYADMSLQIYYVIVSIYGWITWRRGNEGSGTEIPVRKTKVQEALVLTGVTILIFFIYYYILRNLTDSPLPFADSFTTALSITATWMLAKKMIEHWILWVIVDVVSAGLYLYKDLHVTTFLFIVYSMMAVVGFMQWRKSLKSK
jgi:nicotinamide mononucleotide transporter